MTSQQGMEILLDHSRESSASFPLLNTLLHRFSQELTSSSERILTRNTLSTHLSKVSHVHADGFLKTLTQSTFFWAEFYVQGWEGSGFLLLDTKVLITILSEMLGNDVQMTVSKLKNANFENCTPLEKQLNQKFLSFVIQGLQETFQELSDTTWSLKSCGSQLKEDFLPSGLMCVGQISCEIESIQGDVYVILPYATLQPVHDLIQIYGEQGGSDQLWKDHIQKTLHTANVKLDVILGHTMIPLREVLAWKVGDTISFPLSPDALVEIQCENAPLFLAKTGRQKGGLAVSIEKKLK